MLYLPCGTLQILFLNVLGNRDNPSVIIALAAKTVGNSGNYIFSYSFA